MPGIPPRSERFHGYCGVTEIVRRGLPRTHRYAEYRRCAEQLYSVFANTVMWVELARCRRSLMERLRRARSLRLQHFENALKSVGKSYGPHESGRSNFGRPHSARNRSAWRAPQNAHGTHNNDLRRRLSQELVNVAFIDQRHTCIDEGRDGRKCVQPVVPRQGMERIVMNVIQSLKTKQSHGKGFL
jgi:hypothetical protein